MQLTALPMGVRGAEESVMVLDSDSESDDEEEEEYGRGGQSSSYHAGFRSLPGDTRGGADEPIEIESSSDEEGGVTRNTNGSQTSQPRRDLQLQKKKSGTNGGYG